MWQCENCGYTDEDGGTFDLEKATRTETATETATDTATDTEESARYCPECGSDEVYEVDEDDADPPIGFIEDDDDPGDGDSIPEGDEEDGDTW